jgi:hypothetical protein
VEPEERCECECECWGRIGLDWGSERDGYQIQHGQASPGANSPAQRRRHWPVGKSNTEITAVCCDKRRARPKDEGGESQVRFHHHAAMGLASTLQLLEA